MKYLNWDPEKNKLLKLQRSICFEEIAYYIEAEKILGVEENPSHSNQKMYVLEIENYAVIVPFVKPMMKFFSKQLFQAVNTRNYII